MQLFTVYRTIELQQVVLAETEDEARRISAGHIAEQIMDEFCCEQVVSVSPISEVALCPAKWVNEIPYYGKSNHPVTCGELLE